MKPGLPDFSGHNKPKRGEKYQIAIQLPHGHTNILNIFQMVKKYTNLFRS
jgi:hypothetical protein